MSFQLFVSQHVLDTITERVNKINSRAAKRGWNGTFELTATPATRKEKKHGVEFTYHGFDIELTGTPPCYEGWTFIAAVDVAPAGVVIRHAPGVEPVDASTIAAGSCDHCKTKRARRHTFLVRHEDGTVMQVGKTCMKDFLGWMVNPYFISDEDIEDELFRGTAGFSPDLDTIEVAQYAFACADTWGYKNSYADVSTRAAVSKMMYHHKGWKDIFDEIEPNMIGRDETQERINTILPTLTEAGFEQSLHTILSGDTVIPKHLGIAVAVASVWDRLTKKQAENAAKEAEYQSQWIGDIGEKITVTGKAVGVTVVESMYGYSNLVVLSVGKGDRVKMFTSARWSDDIEIGEEVTISATVKDHDEFNGRQETLVNRPKRI